MMSSGFQGVQLQAAEERASSQSAHRPEDTPGTPARDKSSRGSDDQAPWHKVQVALFGLGRAIVLLWRMRNV